MSKFDVVERVMAAVKQRMEDDKALIDKMTEEQKEQYVEELLFQEFTKMIGKGELH